VPPLLTTAAPANDKFLFGRATGTSGNIEGLHDQPESPAAILVDEAKSIRDEVLDALERCHTSYRLFMSSTGAAFGGFYQICTANAHLRRAFQISHGECVGVPDGTPNTTVSVRPAGLLSVRGGERRRP
jgi:hypothetical protein